MLFCLVKLGKKVIWFISGWMLMGLVFICAGFIMYLVWSGVSSLLPNASGVVRSIASTLTIVSIFAGIWKIAGLVLKIIIKII